MFWFGLLLMVATIPGYTGMALPAQWAVLSFVLPFSLWSGIHASPLHYLGLGFLAFATLGLFWSPSFYVALNGLWMDGILALSFFWGSTKPSLRALYHGLAVGLAVSSAFAVAQAFGFTGIATYANNYGGLLFNPVILGGTCAIMIPILLRERLWLYIPALLPGLILANSRGAYLALAVALAVRYLHWTVAAIALGIAGIYFTYHVSDSDAVRLETWSIALHHLSLLGMGPGSFNAIFFAFTGTIAPFANTIVHPEFVHNDYLQLWFEYGIFALAPLTILALAAGRAELTAVAVLALFSFPLYYPISGFIAFAIAGHTLRDFHLPRLRLYDRGSAFLLRLQSQEPSLARQCSQAIPSQPRHSHSET